MLETNPARVAEFCNNLAIARLSLYDPTETTPVGRVIGLGSWFGVLTPQEQDHWRNRMRQAGVLRAVEGSTRDTIYQFDPDAAEQLVEALVRRTAQTSASESLS